MENNNTVQKFLNDMFGEVRVVTKDNEIWFVADDIATVLQYNKAGDMTRNLDDDESASQTLRISSNNGVVQNREMTIINESGLYNAVLSITKRNKERHDKAREFKKWITKTVIPSIRKDGGYIDKEEKVVTGEMTEDELVYKAMQVMNTKITRLKEENLILQNENEQLKPIASLVDTFVNTSGYYDIGTYAKMLESKELGQKRLFAWLREQKILMDDNEPYQQYMKYFKVIPVTKNNKTYSKTLLRPLGITYIYKKLIKDGKVINKSLDDIVRDLQETA